MSIREPRILLSAGAPVHVETVVLQLKNELIVLGNEECAHGHEPDGERHLVAQCWMDLALWKVSSTPIPVDAEQKRIELPDRLEGHPTDNLNDRGAPKLRKFLRFLSCHGRSKMRNNRRTSVQRQQP